ncbi:MAG TPA: rhomboid family intramembrane serine protease [Tepidisphaeraceae bacterium]|jgi:GlpG protein
MIGTIPTAEAAQRFVDYLLTQRINASAESDGRDDASANWQIWVEHDDHLDVGREELAAFLRNPTDSRYDSAANADRIRKEAERAAMRRQENYKDVRTSSARVRSAGTPVALVLIAISVALSLLTGFARDPSQPMVSKLAFDDFATAAPQIDAGERRNMFASVAQGQIWRTITPIFLHGDIFHLLFNMMWLWRLGQLIESLKGSRHFLILVVVTAVMSCCMEAAWAMVSPFNQWHWSFFLGFSGVNAGLFGYAWMKRRYQSYERIYVSDQDVGLMIGWLVLCTTGIVGNIANVAHWGGLLCGMAFVLIPLWQRKLMRKRM